MVKFWWRNVWKWSKREKAYFFQQCGGFFFVFTHSHNCVWAYLVKPQYNSLVVRLNSWCASVSAPLFPTSPHCLLSEESDKILRECEKETSWPFSPSCFFLKISSLALEETFESVWLECSAPGRAVTPIYCCHQNMNYRMLDLWSRLLFGRELPGAAKTWPLTQVWRGWVSGEGTEGGGRWGRGVKRQGGRREK